MFCRMMPARQGRRDVNGVQADRGGVYACDLRMGMVNLGGVRGDDGMGLLGLRRLGGRGLAGDAQMVDGCRVVRSFW